jgi:hypothetical protein
MSNRERTPLSEERANAETAPVATPEIPDGYPELTASQLDLIRHRSTETAVDPGACLGNAVDVDYDLILVEAGDVEVVRFATFGLPEQVIGYGPSFVRPRGMGVLKIRSLRQRAEHPVTPIWSLGSADARSRT